MREVWTNRSIVFEDQLENDGIDELSLLNPDCMMLRFAPLLALVLAACSAGGPAEPLTALNVSNATWVKITDDGAGAVRAGTPYNETALAAVAPGADIRSIQTAKEDSTAWTHAAFIDETQAVQFFKGRGNIVGEIHGVSQHLEGPNGERIGMTMAQAGTKRRHCRNGKKLWRGMAVCKARGASHVELVFSIPEYEGPFNRLASAKDLQRAELQRIVWRAKS
ncbi:MAG: DUF1131 family protein [Pseudomonadota bacterium]